MAVDPVCGMVVPDENNPYAEPSEYKGRTYSFCSEECKAEFDQDPGFYAGDDEEFDVVEEE